jgi:hypothetical protein
MSEHIRSSRFQDGDVFERAFNNAFEQALFMLKQ